MDENRKAATVERQPGNDLAEQRGAEGELTGPARMRPDLFFVHAPHLDARKSLGGRLAERARLFNGAFPEIDMGVPVIDVGGLGHHAIVRATQITVNEGQ